MKRFININTFTDVAFILMSILFYKMFLKIYHTQTTIFVLFIFLVFGLYGITLRLSLRNPIYMNQNKTFTSKYKKTSFWLKISHILAFIYIPLAIFIFYSVKQNVNEGPVIILSFVLIPFLSLFVIACIGKEKSSKKNIEKKYLKKYIIFLTFSLLLVFLFIEVVFWSSGYTVTLTITQKIFNIDAKVPSLIPLVIYRLLFLWLIYIPIRLTLYLNQETSSFSTFTFILSCFIILLNGIFNFDVLELIF